MEFSIASLVGFGIARHSTPEKPTLFVKSNAAPGSKVSTDVWKCFNRLEEAGTSIGFRVRRK